MKRENIPRELEQCIQGFERQGYELLDTAKIDGVWTAGLENEAGTFRTVSYNPAVREVRINFEVKRG